MNETESGWLIETRRNGYPEWARFEEGGVVWTTDSRKACRFARREDAEQLAYGENCDAITEHSWPDEPWPGEESARSEAVSWAIGDREERLARTVWDACMSWLKSHKERK